MKIKVSALLGALLVFLMIGLAFARGSYMTAFNTRYGTTATVLNTCNLCHPGGDTGSLNAYGDDFLNAGRNVAAFIAIEGLDSDGDGFTNIVEINARSFPGDPSSFPAGDAAAPVLTGFSIPATATALTVPILVFTATDNVAVTGFLVNEVSAKPAAGAAGWAATPPASYLFATAGAKTLYGWAKDAAGNVSSALSATVAITLPDTTAPTVTAFAIPATSTSLTVAIAAFTATDAVGVTGYLVTESATAPAASAVGWTASAPTAYTFTTEGFKTLYGWAKDAAGNVSSALSATVAITLINSNPGTIQGSISVHFAGHSNLGVANATVSLAGTNYTTTTDVDGKFMLANILPGSYQIVVASPDVAATAPQITLDPGANLQMNILAVAPTRGDANGDNKLGLEDVVYILQVLSKMR
jgi:hypothetical protein